ncbi:hypothetical protein RRV45_13425 [Bacillus sp. DTU_2020_1000418_1_SI_GHA_SEK_038]|uniref:HAD family hydrolase n=1 Tax=Bacillus sp. DTU_2020_1000418_1_SI_GHA_SEK_038 TaxID=3077585 RepID=UPI0028EBCCF4|nr:hypothetical protein [Bacillus sp. DTU_2020_1000418_1_SI_GHA_SEK_038]WNS73918.1 hypothetical protein RRV45_13425 [Bacillus sp. DTU_2020_1000418_1_SI_GHA_SEK_038]
MKMFASDLDRTLIYSERALADFKQTGVNDLIGVEKKADREVAFMTRRSAEALCQIADHMLFVPVTTRTWEQFKRIFIFSNYIPLTYAITSNGANITYKGNSLIEWQGLIHERLRSECNPIDGMEAELRELKIPGTIKRAEGLFLYYILDVNLSKEEIMIVKSKATEFGWRVSLQGRKLYFMPNPISKGEAVRFIKEREGISTVYGAGDSLLDHDFLKDCDFPFVPSHGELANEFNEDYHYTLTNTRGVMAGEEILAEIFKTVTNKPL